MYQNLQGVPETLLIPLWARAAETREKKPILKDEKAVEILGKIDYDFSKFKGSWLTQTGVAVRTEILDREVKKFIQKHPGAVVVNIGCGLDTRYLRVDNGRIHWYDLDLPEPIGIRKSFFKESGRYRMIGKSVFDYSWVQDVQIEGAQILFLAEGVFMYFTEQEIKELMNHLTKLFPGSHLLFEMLPRFLVKFGGKHETVRKTEARFQWGIRSGRDMELLHPQIALLKNGIFLIFIAIDGNGWAGWL